MERSQHNLSALRQRSSQFEPAPISETRGLFSWMILTVRYQGTIGAKRTFVH